MFVEPPAAIAIVGAGPIGLEAALYARYLGYNVELFEAGRVADNVLRWGHVRMFTPFGMNCSPLAVAALIAQDDAFAPPADDALLTGREWAEQYLLPLAHSDLVIDGLREKTRVAAIGKSDARKRESVGSPQRVESPFRLLLVDEQGRESIATADVVLDTTGVFGNPCWLGAGGIPAPGERQAASRIDYGLPDILGADRESYAGRHTLLVGAGYSAATSAVALAQLAAAAPGTRATWITNASVDDGAGPIRRIAGDRLPERDALAQAANAVASAGGPITHLGQTSVDSISAAADDAPLLVRLCGAHAGEVECDRIIANVGYRPDASLYAELQVHQCYATDGPMKLAAALSQADSVDCLAQQSAGAQALVNPEPNFYILGSKSYGRNSNFLYSLGLAQIREVFSLIGGR
ncbi:MAG: hypothetical protein KDA41_21935, partial [Planctomycetales bacterium]|nr:hypothetical protein [Planctomycetales bacterium]